MTDREVELTIDRMSTLGEGVAPLEGRSAFVWGAYPGERVLARVREEGRVLRAEVVRVLAASPERREAACEYFGRCGGCDWLDLSERAQREARSQTVLAALEHLGGISRAGLEVRPTVPPPRAFGYRRRAVLHWARGGFGFFGRRSHDLVMIGRCPALVDPLQALPGALTEALGTVGKEVRALHLLCEQGKVAIALLLKGAAKPRIQAAVEGAMQSLGLAGAVLVPETGAPVLLGKPVLRAENPLRPEVPLYLRPDAFSQANAEGNLGLVTCALQLLAPREEEELLELYCGNGNFTFALAGVAKSVLAAESSKVSLELALRSGREAKVENVRFVEADAGKLCEGLIREGRQFHALLADPPRTGAPGLAGWARRLGARRVVYVACDAGALARDTTDLRKAGFEPRVLQLVDMFPQTHHVEAVMSFERLQNACT